MKKNINLTIYIFIGLFLCSILIILGQSSELFSANNVVEVLAEKNSDLVNMVIKKENTIAAYELDLNTAQETLSDMNKSHDLLLEDNISIEQELKQLQLLVSRAELLEKDEGNKFIETNVFEKLVYLTFDDGPSYRTLDILDILDKYSIKATFFVTYHRTAKEKNIYNEIVSRGHVIGNHTYDHVLPGEDWDEFLLSLFKMEDFIFDETGVRTRIIRFPGGSVDAWKDSLKYIENVETLTNLGYIYFDWNVGNHDSDSDMGYVSEEKMLDMVIAESRGRDKIMLLMHDRANKYATVNYLADIIKHYTRRGYIFLPITSESFRPQFFSRDDYD